MCCRFWETNSFNPPAALQAGEYLGIEGFIFGLGSFSSICDKVGEEVSVVGYPTETGSGSFKYSQGVLVVNQKSLEKKGISELLNYLFSLESQEMIEDEISVRQDACEGRILYDSDNNKYYWVYPSGKREPLKVKEDGSTYYDEYQSLLMSAVPYTFSMEDVFNVIYNRKPKLQEICTTRADRWTMIFVWRNIAAMTTMTST